MVVSAVTGPVVCTVLVVAATPCAKHSNDKNTMLVMAAITKIFFIVISFSVVRSTHPNGLVASLPIVRLHGEWQRRSLPQEHGLTAAPRDIQKVLRRPRAIQCAVGSLPRAIDAPCQREWQRHTLWMGGERGDGLRSPVRKD